jgi:glycosyltransferase involved in cell wall biosynthesis
VDFDYWKPFPVVDQPRLPLIYLKVAWPDLRDEVVHTLRQAGIKFREITYGSYSPKQYKSLLQASSCVIYIGGSESQGLALLEAWAMNVPTFVFDAPSQVIYLADGRSMKLTRGDFSPAPYLTRGRGGLWSESSELPELELSAESYSPRAASISEFTDAIRAKHYLQIAAL